MLILMIHMLLGVKSTRLCLFNDTATTEIYTLSLHDALPIWTRREEGGQEREFGVETMMAALVCPRAWITFSGT